MGSGVRSIALAVVALALAAGVANAQRAIGFDERPQTDHPAFLNEALIALGSGYRDLAPPGRLANANYLNLSTAPEPAGPGACKSHVLTLGFPDGQLRARRDGSPSPLTVDYARMNVMYRAVGDLRDRINPDDMDRAWDEAKASCQRRTDGWAFPVYAENDEDAWQGLRVMDLLRTERARNPDGHAAPIESCVGSDCDAAGLLWTAVLEGQLQSIEGRSCEAFPIAQAPPLSPTDPQLWCLILGIQAVTPRYPDGIYLTMRVRIMHRIEWIGSWGQRVDPVIEAVGIYEPEPMYFDP